METQLLFEMSATLSEPLTIPATPEGDRVIVYVTGGKFEGPRLRGEVLPGGGDWLLVRADGTGMLDVRVVLKTDDGETIYVTYRGFVRLVPRDEMSPVRTAPYFQASTKGKYAWLNSVQAVGEGEGSLEKHLVRYKVYEVK
jgi:hypothetical protein